MQAGINKGLVRGWWVNYVGVWTRGMRSIISELIRDGNII
jgi:hypothetical protein